jgi:hypothetical protein
MIGTKMFFSTWLEEEQNAKWGELGYLFTNTECVRLLTTYENVQQDMLQDDGSPYPVDSTFLFALELLTGYSG